ncbi:TPA: hypothetical protein ACU95R_005785 [Pseudomonas aeruginosa]
MQQNENFAKQAEQAEAERPEVVAWRYGSSGGIVSDKACLDEWKSGGEYQSLMTVAQHERIVKAWIERWKAYIELSAKIAAQRDAADARLHEVATACATAEQERDAALARVAELESKLAELEKQEPIGCRMSRSALTEAQMRRLYENSTDIENERLGFAAFARLMRRAEAVHQIAAAPSQAQHSVPEGWMLVECGIWTQEQVDEMQKTVARFRSSEFVDDRALAMAVADAGQCKAPEISLAELLAAAPGKEVGHE